MSTPALTITQMGQQHIADAKMNSLTGARSYINLTRLDVPPPDARPIVVVSQPYPFYPAPGAAAQLLLNYVVPVGFNSVFNFMAIFHVGGGYVNGSGNVIWRVLVNGAGWKGMNNLQSQFGSDSAPINTYIHLVENDNLQITAEIPLGQAAMPPGASTGARAHGFEYAIGKF